MEAYSKDLLRGIGGAGADDGEEKVQRLESRTEEVDLSLGLSLGGRFGTDRRSGEGLAGSSSVPLAPPAPVMTNSPPRGGLPLSSIKEEPVAGLPSQGSPDGQGTPSAQGRSLSSAVVSWSEATNRVMASASALIAAALGSGGGRQDASARPVAMMREMPLVWTSGLPNGMRTIGFLYEYNRVDQVRILCVCHGSFFTPAGFVEHAGGGQVANPLRSILVKRPSWL